MLPVLERCCLALAPALTFQPGGGQRGKNKFITGHKEKKNKFKKITKQGESWREIVTVTFVLLRLHPQPQHF